VRSGEQEGGLLHEKLRDCRLEPQAGGGLARWKNEALDVRLPARIRACALSPNDQAMQRQMSRRVLPAQER